jgi:putative N6-adenine-specific DNA methylase
LRPDAPVTERPGTLFAICPPGFEPLVAAEIAEAGFAGANAVPGGVIFSGNALAANRALALPTRILQRVSRFEARDFAALQRGAAAVNWSAWGHLGFDLEVSSHRSRLYHTGAVAERVAALVPAGSLGLYVRLEDDVCTLSVDTSGELLHKRGWREETGPAPLRETLAATLLRLAGWRPGESLHDPMCGSGTFLIEAAVQAAGLAPGRLRHFACEAFCALAPAAALRAPVATHIAGGDRARPAVESARRNAARAGVTVPLETLEAAHARPGEAPPGLLICNPPYDRRAPGAAHALDRLALALAGPFKAWRAAVLVPDLRAAERLGRPVTEVTRVNNGGLWLQFVQLGPGA